MRDFGGNRPVAEITPSVIAAEIDRAKDHLINVLDRLILQFQAEHPAFVSAYEAARKVIRTGARTELKPGNTPK